jgi:nitric oxide reductase subunit B
MPGLPRSRVDDEVDGVPGWDDKTFRNTFRIRSHATGLTLMSLRALTADREWKEGVLKVSFWAMNIGLMMMILLSLLPVGLLQTWASVHNGYWYARSEIFMDTPLMQTLRWLRVPGDSLFAVGAIALVYFIFGLRYGWSIDQRHHGEELPRAA